MEQPSTVSAYQGSLHPPWASGTTSMVPASPQVKLRALLWFVVIALGVGVPCGIIGLLVAGEEGLLVGPLIVGMFVLLGGYAALTLQQAPCPYCQGVLGDTFRTGLSLRDENRHFECPHCFEWLVRHKGAVRALRDEDVALALLYTCPVFQHGGWPDECLVCGGPATRRMEAKALEDKTLERAAAVLADSASVVKGVPYCQAHENQVFVHIGNLGELLLVFMDYGARRRYLAANVRRVPMKLK
jgi:hypothetical protein